MEEPAALSALARVERSIVEFTSEQRQIQHSITQLRNEIADAFAHDIGFGRSSSARYASPQENFDYSATFNLSSAFRPDESHHSGLSSKVVSCRRTAHSIGSHTRRLRDREDHASEISQPSQSSLSPNWPATVPVRPYWENLDRRAQARLSMSQALDEGLERGSSRNPRSFTRAWRSEQVQNENEIEQSERILIPGSLKRSILDLIGMTLLMWDLAFTPLQIAWSLNIEGWLLVATACVSTFWTLDIIFSSCTAYYRTTGDLETRPLKVLLHYLRRQFLIDVIVVVADWISLLVGWFPGASSLLRISKMTRLVRLLRVARLTRLNDMEDVLNSYGIAQHVVESVKIVLFTMFLAHAFSCLWFMVGNLHSSDTGYRWVDSTWEDSSPTFLETPISFQYCAALQWTLTTLISGTSSILALNSTEQVASCCVILTGLVYQAFVVSILSAVAVESKSRQRYLAGTLSSLSKFCKAHKISKQIALTARSQARAAVKLKANASLSVKEVHGFQKIASKIRTTLLSEAFEPHLSRHEIFYLWSQCEKSIYSKLINGAMDFMYVNSGMDVFMASEAATSSYLLSKGRAIYVQDPNGSKVFQKTTVRVSLDKWLAEAALWTEWQHVGTLEAASDECEVCCLSIQGFLLAIESSTKISNVIGAYAREFQQRLAQAMPPSLPWPSDLGTLGVEFMQILPALQEPVRTAFASLALDCATRMDLIGEAQEELLTNEINGGKANLVLVKYASRPSLQRLVSVIRISVKRADGSIFVHLGKLHGETCAPKCELPGAKLTDREDIGAIAERIIATLSQHIDNIAFEDDFTLDEFATSHKTQIPTYYSITHISYVSRAIGERPSTRPSRSNSVNFFRHRRASINESALEQSLRSQRGLTTVEYDNGETFLCTWLNETEFQFLKSKDGETLLNLLCNEGITQRRLQTQSTLDTSPETDGNFVFGSFAEKLGGVATDSDVIEEESFASPNAPRLTRIVQHVFN